MKRFTILIPAMLDDTFGLLKCAFASPSVRVLILYNTRDALNTGLRRVHNDICAPCAIMTGQLIKALRSGKIDVENCAFLTAQAGDACRGSNYIPLIRRALKNEGFDIPVLSLNFLDMEEGARFRLSPSFLFKCTAAVFYSDILMILRSQVRPYEVEKGSADALYDRWIKRFRREIFRGEGLDPVTMCRRFGEIADSFAAIERRREKRTRVGFVGELYMKYCAIGNRDLRGFYERRGAEVVINGFSWYCLYYIDSHLTAETELGAVMRTGYRIAGGYFTLLQKRMVSAIRSRGFSSFEPFPEFKCLAERHIPCICPTGDGWLIGAEICGLAEMGVGRCACLQPFGCMPNHVCGRGLYSSIQRRLGNIRLQSIDFDSSLPDVNIYNRAELLLTPDFKGSERI
ncbi:Predicted nucleotide-binding protein, sugar kinase/HSP70/actin superfamily [Ruminococcus sp. YE71]|uniref:2-hydroxyacyl-CoA dehydratase n=1 Tax=unclassified Ruminococcus TaxID=2608920 RepID=UPI000889D5E1|nr:MULTISPECIES: 2-hydroxyacyl-CoA dehydratase [unclassified Ruminococcus]SDA17639.1 Predicted nucleotide-binding protein, sugar kinase/HSP70/actin superfamily [Ruminococcus sp. YE78]SFW27143.1 Predicted nucleotide-binding protein, sugar kinase/HSP70/actin superfamily [Ruminococcus sp. YE71]